MKRWGASILAVVLSAGCAAEMGPGPDLGCETCDEGGSATTGIVRGSDVAWLRCWTEPGTYAFELESDEYYDNVVCERSVDAITINDGGEVGAFFNFMSVQASAGSSSMEASWQRDAAGVRTLGEATNVFDNTNQEYPVTLTMTVSMLGGKTATKTIVIDEPAAPQEMTMPFDLWPVGFSDELERATLALGDYDIVMPEGISFDGGMAPGRIAPGDLPVFVPVSQGSADAVPAALTHGRRDRQTVDLQITGPGTISVEGFTPSPEPEPAPDSDLDPDSAGD